MRGKASSKTSSKKTTRKKVANLKKSPKREKSKAAGLTKRIAKTKVKKKKLSLKQSIIPPKRPVVSLQEEKEVVEESKFAVAQEVAVEEFAPLAMQYDLPVRYVDNRIVLMPTLKTPRSPRNTEWRPGG